MCLTLFSRLPTAHERQLWEKAKKSGLNKNEDLAYALLNTRQFILCSKANLASCVLVG